MGSFDALGRERKTHCKKGHPYDEVNTYWHENWKGYQCRGCRACVREAMQRRRTVPGVLERQAAKQKRWREAHPDACRAAYMKAHEQKRQLLCSARSQGCIRCGEKHPACLDFHHRNGKLNKLGNIGQIRRYSFPRILAEIEKCDVLCANCHRKHHYDERQKQLSEGD